jgi:hypothetical protein
MSDAVAEDGILAAKLELIISDGRFTFQRDALSSVKNRSDGFGKTAFFGVNDEHGDLRFA